MRRLHTVLSATLSMKRLGIHTGYLQSRNGVYRQRGRCRLPAYNIQIGVADEYIVVADVFQHRSDMDCFIPLMEKFQQLYDIYPKYPVADAGYGSYNNYLFCQEHGMEKYMKFPMYKKETTEEKYRENPFRAVNFKTDQDGNLVHISIFLLYTRSHSRCPGRSA